MGVNKLLIKLNVDPQRWSLVCRVGCEVLGSIPASSKTFLMRTCRDKVVRCQLRKKELLKMAQKLTLAALITTKTGLNNQSLGQNIQMHFTLT